MIDVEDLHRRLGGLSTKGVTDPAQSRAELFVAQTGYEQSSIDPRKPGDSRSRSGNLGEGQSYAVDLARLRCGVHTVEPDIHPLVVRCRRVIELEGSRR